LRHHRKKLFLLERLFEAEDFALLVALCRDFANGRHEHDRDMPKLGVFELESSEFEPVQVGHSEVEQDEVGRTVTREQRQRFLSIGSEGKLYVELGQESFDDAVQVELILDDKDLSSWFHC
jgi:hypothetical protein